MGKIGLKSNSSLSTACNWLITLASESPILVRLSSYSSNGCQPQNVEYESPGSVPKTWIHFGPLWVWFSRIPGEDPHIVCRQVIPYVFSIVSTWLLQFVPSKVSTFSRIMHKIHLNCPHVIPNPFLILSHFFPIRNNSTDSPSCAGSLTSRSPICRCPRRTVSSDRRQNRRNHLWCRRYRRPSWARRWGRNHGQNGGGDQTTNEDGDIVPTLSYPS